ncbi:hypothetical protein ADL21_10520 [Streptomyces albus subsp. albus]|nr:hypothetical protein ADL21_10520 [Streptomyces albus subsp. albus]
MLNWLYNTFWATLIRKVCTVLVVLAVVVSLALILPGRIGAPEYCAEGVERSAGECVGVSGSGYDFGTREIREVAHAIGEENTRVSEQEQDLVTIAMMLPLQPKSAAERKQLRSELQGAYLAQWRANRTENKPLLRLVLANPGADYAQQKKVVDRLAAMADSRRDNLRAVTGFNLSLGNTRTAIDRLTNELHIPVLASRVSADDIANADNSSRLKYPGLARIIPTNRKQAAALANFHGGLRDAETVLVKDMRPNDIYDESLAKAFSKPEPGPPGPQDQPYTSPGINDPGDTGNDFTTIGQNICESDAKVVYFAGRPVHLRLFALKLAQVPCHGKKYTVVSGSGAATLDRYMSVADWEKLRGGDGGRATVTVQYAAPGHPDAWDASLRQWEKEQRARTGRAPAAGDRPAYLTEPQKELRELNGLIRRQDAGDIGDVDLEDSRTMLVHDGVRTIAAAVFLANSQAAGTVPTRARVAAQWPRLEARYRVVGTSGWICLTNAGNAYDKPVAVVQLDPATRRVAFVGLGWPEKKPQPADCVVPSGTG